MQTTIKLLIRLLAYCAVRQTVLNWSTCSSFSQRFGVESDRQELERNERGDIHRMIVYSAVCQVSCRSKRCLTSIKPITIAEIYCIINKHYIESTTLSLRGPKVPVIFIAV